MIFTDVLEMIGNTPMIELTHTDTGACRLFLKLENQYPENVISTNIMSPKGHCFCPFGDNIQVENSYISELLT
jgi:hypothetical protein